MTTISDVPEISDHDLMLANENRRRIAGLLSQIQNLLPGGFRVTLLCRGADAFYENQANLVYTDERPSDYPEMVKAITAYAATVQEQQKAGAH